MSLFAVTFEMQSLTIDDGAVNAAIDRGERAALTSIGETLDEAATASLKFRDRPSRPGETPTARATGSRSLRNIASAYMSSDHSVIVGSVGFPASRFRGQTVPERLEHGDRSYMRPQLERASRGNTLRDAWTGAIA